MAASCPACAVVDRPGHGRRRVLGSDARADLPAHRGASVLAGHEVRVSAASASLGAGIVTLPGAERPGHLHARQGVPEASPAAPASGGPKAAPRRPTRWSAPSTARALAEAMSGRASTGKRHRLHTLHGRAHELSAGPPAQRPGATRRALGTGQSPSPVRACRPRSRPRTGRARLRPASPLVQHLYGRLSLKSLPTTPVVAGRADAPKQGRRGRRDRAHGLRGRGSHLGGDRHVPVLVQRHQRPAVEHLRRGRGLHDPMDPRGGDRELARLHLERDGVPLSKVERGRAELDRRGAAPAVELIGHDVADATSLQPANVRRRRDGATIWESVRVVLGMSRDRGANALELRRTGQELNGCWSSTTGSKSRADPSILRLFEGVWRHPSGPCRLPTSASGA